MTGVRILFVLAMFGAQGAIAADTGSPGTSPELRQRAEDLAGAASQRFTDILDVEHTAPPPHDAMTAHNAQPATGSMAPVWDWLTRSAQSYDEIVIAQLKAKDDWTTIVERDGSSSSPAPQTTPQVVPELRGWNGLLELVRYWLARANSTYRTEIVTPLRMPFGTPAPNVPSPMTASTSGAGAAPTQPPEKRQAEEAIKREAEAADKQRRGAEAADAERRAAEEKRIAASAEEKRKAQEEARARLIAESEAKRKAAEAEAEKARLADAEQRAAEAKRAAEQAEAKRVADTEAEAKRKAEDDAKRAAAEADAAERRAVAEAEAQAKRQAEIDAEATRRMQAAADAKGSSRAEQVPAAKTGTGPVTGPVPPFPPAVTQESSDIAIAPAVPEKKPGAPDKTAKVVAKSRDELTDEAVEPVAKPSQKSKVTVAKSSRAGKHIYAKKSKSRIAFKKAPRRHRKVHFGKRNWSAGSIVVGRHCACRCGRVLLKPRKHRHAHRLMHAPKHRVTRRHRAVSHGAHRARLTHRHRLHYID